MHMFEVSHLCANKNKKYIPMRPFLPLSILFLTINSFQVQVSAKKPISSSGSPHGLMRKMLHFWVSFSKSRQNVPFFFRCDLYQFNTAMFEINGGMSVCEQHADGKWETTTAARTHEGHGTLSLRRSRT